MPERLDGKRALGPVWGDWLDRLPRLFGDLLDEWELTSEDGRHWHGACSLVAPVMTDDGTSAVLKITFDGDNESRHEGLALQHWHGVGAVRLLRADPHRRALLLERLTRRDLTDAWDLEACGIVAGLYRDLHLAALPQLTPVTVFVARWLDDLAGQPRDIPIPPRFRAQASSLGRELVADRASVGRIIHGDLHYENVLAAGPEQASDRGQWLAIDPKPFAGHPGFELQPLLRNRSDELGTGSALRWSVRHRLEVAAAAAGVDPEEARLWSLLHTGVQILWSRADPEAASLHIALFKALED